MSIEAVLSCLDGVRGAGHGKYVARCPAHNDKSPSLAIKNCDDGRLLLHCFAGCETEDVLSAVGLTFSDLMPECISSEHSYKPQKFDARQVLECIAHEVMVVVLIADRYSHLAADIDDKRLMLAVSRINNAFRAAPVLREPRELKAIRRAT
jgi:hypothetical protein